LPGLVKVAVEFSTRKAEIDYEPGVIAVDQIVGEVKRLGFDAEPT
jgi:copper chaperone CopZ